MKECKSSVLQIGHINFETHRHNYNGERSKGSVDATPADEDSVGVQCQVKQMSKEKIRRIGQHLSGSKGKCSVVVLCWIIIVV